MDTDRRRTAIGLLAIAVIALLIVVLPAGGDVVDVVSGAVQVAFLAALAFAAVRLYRSQGMWLNSLPDRDRGVLYGALSIGVLTIVAQDRFREVGSGGTVLWFGALAACGVAIYWVWRESRRYVI